MKPRGTRTLTPPVLLPNGKEFRTWEQPLVFKRTYHVDGADPNASDANPGTRKQPFKTISRAADVLQPGERVVVAAGVYRERIRPPRGGRGPRAMISYQAAARAKVVIKGSEVFEESWTRSTNAGPRSAKVWTAPLAPRYFQGENPFREPNVTPEQFNMMPWAAGLAGQKPYVLPRGLVFQNGRRLAQVNERADLAARDGTYWVEPDGTKLHIHPFGDSDPNRETIEITTRGSVFEPEQMGLGYIHIKGFVVEQVGNPFPMPQYGAVSTTRGHHWLIEDNVVRGVNGVGIDIGQQYPRLPQPKVLGCHIVRRNTVAGCGVCGICGIAPHNSLIEDNVLLRNAFHDVEMLFETASIKTHGNRKVLIRRNLIIDTLHGSGIWMDYHNVFSRCTQNIIIRSATMFGGIFIEASSRRNLIDHNFIWDTHGAGIYEHDCANQFFVHNFVGKTTGPAMWLRGKCTGRIVHKRPIVGGHHRVLNNVLFDAKPVEALGPRSTLSGNLTEGVTAAFNEKERTLTWRVKGRIPACERVKGITRDFWSHKRSGPPSPGPFGKPSGKPVRLKRN